MSILANSKKLRVLQNKKVEHEQIMVNSLATSFVEFGRILDEVTSFLMVSTLRGLQFALNSDLQIINRETSFELMELLKGDNDGSEDLLEFERRMAKLNEWLEGR